MISVTVRYATIERQCEVDIDIPENGTVEMAIKRSGILGEFPEIQLSKYAVGVNAKRVALDAPVQARDFIEIYRPLIFDPKERRRRKASGSVN